MKKLSRQEAIHFLENRVRTGKLGTVCQDGTAHVAPIWFLVEGDSLIFNTGKATIKGKNLERTKSATLCVDDETPPFSFVTLKGSVTLTEDLALVRQAATRLGARYMGPDQAEKMGARNGIPGNYLVRLHIDKISGIADITDQ